MTSARQRPLSRIFAGEGWGEGSRALLTQGTFLVLLLLSSSAHAAPPQRIISLAPSATETVFALGLGDRLVGVSAYCDYPPEVAKIDRVGTFLTPNVEAIIAKKPDLIIAVPSPGNQRPVRALEDLGLEVITVNPASVQEIEDSLLTIGKALGREGAARALVAGIERDIASVRARLDDAPLRKVLMVVGQTPLVAAGTGTFQNELIRLAHGINVAASTRMAWPHLSIEFAVAAAPDVIIDTTLQNERRAGAPGGSAFWDQFSTIPAVKAGRVHGTHAAPILRPGPRVAQAYEAMARFIHPERFGNE